MDEDDCDEEIPVENVCYNHNSNSFIYKCVLSSRSNGDSHLRLWFDTMASHSITSDKRLYGDKGPNMRVNIWIKGWNDENKSTLVTSAGMTVFGMMLYYPDACGTIISSYEAKASCYLKFTDNDIRVAVSPHADPSITIIFSQDDDERVLEGRIDADTYRVLCSRNQGRIWSATSEYAIDPGTKLGSEGFKRCMHALYGHKLTCHTCSSYLAKTASMGILSNIPFNATDCHNIDRVCDGQCPFCAIGKSKYMTTREPGRQTEERPAKREPDADRTYASDPEANEEHICIDHMFIDGKPILVCVGVNRNYVHIVPMEHGRREKWVAKALNLIMDDYARNGMTVPVMSHSKRKDTETAHLDDLEHRINEPRVPVTKIRSDNEATFITCAMIAFKTQGKTVNYNNVVAGEHVSLVERTIQTIKERVMSVRVSLKFKVEGKILSWLIGHVAMWMNALYSKRAPQSAWKALVGTQLSYRDLARTTFGEVVVAHQPKMVTQDEPKGELGISLGANPRQPGAIFFYSMITKRIKSRIRFKTKIGLSAVETLGKNKYYVAGENINLSYTQYLMQKSVEEVQDYFDSKITIADKEGTGTTEPIGACFINPADQPIITDNPGIPQSEQDKTRDEDPEAQLIGMTVAIHLADAVIMSARSNVTSTNTSWKKAMAREGFPGVNAMNSVWKELRQIVIEYDVCSPIDKERMVKNCHLSHALYDLTKDKARLVIGKKIYDMIVDYGINTSSPTVNGKIVNLMLSIAIQQNLDFEVWDVKGAFLKSPLETEGVFVRIDATVTREIIDMLEHECMKDPQNIKLKEKFEKWKWNVRKDGTMMVEVNKGWYGLSAASALWYKEISKTLIETAGYTQSTYDRCVFIKKLAKGLAYVLLHVDDLGVMIPPRDAEWTRLKNILETQYEKLSVKKGDRVKYIGLELFRNRQKNRFEITMTDYMQRLCEIHGVHYDKCKEINPADALFFSNEDYEGDDNIDITDETEILLYRSLVMSMQYGNLVVPAVKYHVIHLATRQAHPRKGDYQKALRVLRYMCTMKDKALHIYGLGNTPDIYIYTDAAYNVYKDSISHSGLTVFIGEAGGAMHCHSNKQKSVTRSSTEAEIVAACEAMDIAQFYKNFMIDLGFTNVRVIHYQDNMSCISLVESGCYAYDKKARHVVLKINFMTEYFEDPENNACMVWCPTHWMIADLMTKDIHGAQFKALESVILGYEDIDLGPYEKKVVTAPVSE